MRTQWVEPQRVQVSDALQKAIGGHPLFLEILTRRGYTQAEQAQRFLDPDKYTPSPPGELPDLEKAVERIDHAINSQEVIGVWGDFDVDGQTATTLLVSALRQIGGQVIFHIPNRDTESHGVNIPNLSGMIANGIDVLLTCDTGIDAFEAVAFARERDVDVIVTDHHDLSDHLPDALAVVNPKRLGTDHPLREIPGVGAAYKLIESLYTHHGMEEELIGFLDLVALGIVADVSILTGDTRYLLQRGLTVLRESPRLSIQAMLELAAIDPNSITEEHIAYQLAPRLNSLGRLSDANPIVDFLTSDDLGKARVFAQQLEGLNEERKLLCDQVMDAALAQIERDRGLLDYAALVLAHPKWPPGVIGIVANRLVEKYYRPTILLSTPDDQLARGSARSIPGIDISAAISSQSDLLTSYGGHPMAAGLSLNPERIAEFRQALSEAIFANTGPEPPQPSIQIDGYVSLNELSTALITDINRMAPFGQGNKYPTLVVRDVEIRSYRLLGWQGNHLQIFVSDSHGGEYRVLRWNGVGKPLPEDRFDLALLAKISTYRNRQELQLEWIDAREDEVVQADLADTIPALEIIDLRDSPDPLKALERMKTDHPMTWVEGENRGEIDGRHRMDLEPNSTLIIWTTPPNQSILRKAINRVSPQKIILVARADPNSEPGSFLTRLTGLVKYALQERDGKTSTQALAAATAQTKWAVLKGLEWLSHRGEVNFQHDQDGEITLEKCATDNGDSRDDKKGGSIMREIEVLLEETEAYRHYFRRADPEALLMA